MSKEVGAGGRFDIFLDSAESNYNAIAKGSLLFLSYFQFQKLQPDYLSVAT